MIEKDTELMHSTIHSICLKWKLILSIIFSKNFYSTLSYALLISNFIVINPVFPFFFYFMWCKVSKATKILFEMALSDWKALWDSEIITGKTFFNLFVSTFDIIFYKRLQRAIGQKSDTFSGFFTLGKRVKMYDSNLEGLCPNLNRRELNL